MTQNQSIEAFGLRSRRVAGLVIRRCTAFLTIAGLLLRCTVRDQFAGLAVLYYMTPLPLLVLGCGIGFVHSILKRARKASTVWGCLCLVTLFWSVCSDWSFAEQQNPQSDEIVVLLANLGNDTQIHLLAERVHHLQPDIMVFVEALAVTEEQKKAWEVEFPEYHWSSLHGGSQLLAKGQISDPWAQPLPDGSRLTRSVITLQGTQIHCFVVDITSNLMRSRKPAFDQLMRFTARSTDQPILVLGDFNTPSDSIHFKTLRSSFKNLFEEAGRGYAPTWPHPLPVLTLDQIWVNEDFILAGCCTHSNPNSDHRMLEGRLLLKPEQVR